MAKYVVEFQCEQTLEVTVEADDDSEAGIRASELLFSAEEEAEKSFKRRGIRVLCADSNFSNIAESKDGK